MIEFRFKNVVVRSSDEAATEDEASAFAEILSGNWPETIQDIDTEDLLEDWANSLSSQPQEPPRHKSVEVQATRKNGSIIIYIASIEPSN